MLSARQLGTHRFMKPSETMCRQSGKSQTSVGAVHRWAPTESLLSESTIAMPIVCCDLSTFCNVDGVAGGSYMYGLSDKCPASVDKLSSLLELISSLDFDSETCP